MLEFILFSIKTQYWREIVSGKKIFEFRKKLPNFSLTKYYPKIIVYSSGEDKAIVGTFEVRRIIELPFYDLMKVSSIDEKKWDSYKTYYKDHKKCSAIEINHCNQAKRIITLSTIRQLDSTFYVPQNYRFVSKKNKEIYNIIHNMAYGDNLLYQDSLF